MQIPLHALLVSLLSLGLVAGSLQTACAQAQAQKDAAPAASPPACSDQVDNDDDGSIDHPADPGCTDPEDNDEKDSPPPPACRDQADNDKDNLIDHPADPGCSDPEDNDEADPPPPPACRDQRDNDGDTFIDHPADPGCSDPSDNDETDPPSPPPVCGDGICERETCDGCAADCKCEAGTFCQSSTGQCVPGEGGGGGSGGGGGGGRPRPLPPPPPPPLPEKLVETASPAPPPPPPPAPPPPPPPSTPQEASVKPASFPPFPLSALPSFSFTLPEEEPSLPAALLLAGEEEEHSFWDRKNFGYSVPILEPENIAMWGQVSLDSKVIGTNLFLALLFFLIIGASCSVFNNVLEDYREQMHGFIRRLPFFSLLYETEETRRLRRTLILTLVILLSALIQSYISPDFSLLRLENIGIWGVTTVTVIVASYTKDIVRFLVATFWHSKALFQAHLAGIALAVACVALSRMFAITPGFLFGIPIGFYVFSKKLEEREGFLEWLGILTMFAASILILALAPLLQRQEVVHDLLLLLYVVLIEGAFFELFPFTHVPGKAILAWKRWVWALTFVMGIFLLLHTMFNPESSLVALQGSLSRTALTILGVYAALSFGLWGWLKWKEQRQER